MTEVTRILDAIEQGDPLASDKLLPLVYGELRVLARQRLANEKPGQTLQATALVHESYLRLVGNENGQSWKSRGHFFAAAAEAMRRILVEIARRKKSGKRGGGLQQVGISVAETSERANVDLIELSEALDCLSRNHPRQAELVKLRYFVGLTIEQSSQVLGISVRTANNDWDYARTWLRREMS